MGIVNIKYSALSQKLYSRENGGMSEFNSLVYEVVNGKTANSLDRLRSSWAEIFKLMENYDFPMKSSQIDNSFTFHSGKEFSFFNQAVVFDSSKETLEKIMNVVSSWKIKNQVLLAGAGLVHAGYLTNRGYVQKGIIPYMGFEANNRFADFKLRDGLTVERTQNQTQLDINIPMLANTFGLPEDFVREYASGMLNSPEAFRYIIYDHDVPVSTSFIFKNGTFAGCFDVATPSEHQRKGYGEELMKYMLNEQFELGTKLVVLQSSTAGESLYRRLGFQVIEYGQVWDLQDPELLNQSE